MRMYVLLFAENNGEDTHDPVFCSSSRFVVQDKMKEVASKRNDVFKEYDDMVIFENDEFLYIKEIDCERTKNV